ncbi:MAG: tetratricopeptide repeat protein [Treponema sp.]|uniref:tetratricopeptide repeat protein n=1 Tax=Treponema sp. TaxID=166 RepID=UPI0025D1A3EC|nr:tetratricopeptide repeat protein [Treponema sp.]MBQ8678285.1 tetratricopeptide repeat protein [Treponema sp.]
MQTLIALVIIVAFGAIVVSFATRKKSGKKGKQKTRAQIIKESTRKLAQDPHNADALIALGDLYYNERAWDKAFPIYETQMGIAPAHREIDIFKASLRQGICAVKLEKIPESFKGLSAAVQINPNDFEVNYYLGVAFYKNNEFEKAVPRFKKAVVVKPEASGINSPLGLALYKAKHYKESLPYLKRALDENPENKEALFAMADGMNESGYGEKAIKVFMHLRPDPEFGAKACLAAGIFHLKMGQPDKAVQDFEIGLKHQNATPEIAIETRYRLANAHFAMKAIGKGIGYLQEIQAVNPQYKDVPQLLSRYSELNQNKNLQTYLMASSSDFVALCRRIVMKYYQRAVAKIIDISVKPENVEILMNIDFVRAEETHIFRFYRTTGAVADLYVREFHARVSEAKADKGVCITAGLFSEEGRKYAEGRPIDLVDKNGLVKILKKIDSN